MLCCPLGKLEGFTTEFCKGRAGNCSSGGRPGSEVFGMAITDSRWLGYVADRNENIFPVEKQIFFKNIIQFPQDPRVTPRSYFERLRISSFSVRNGNAGRRNRLKMPEFALWATLGLTGV